MTYWILRILDENMPNFKFSPKILGKCDFDGIFGKLRKEMTIITYTGSLKYIAPIFLYWEQKQISQGGNDPPLPITLTAYPTPTPG